MTDVTEGFSEAGRPTDAVIAELRSHVGQAWAKMEHYGNGYDAWQHFERARELVREAGSQYSETYRFLTETDCYPLRGIPAYKRICQDFGFEIPTRRLAKIQADADRHQAKVVAEADRMNRKIT